MAPVSLSSPARHAHLAALLFGVFLFSPSPASAVDMDPSLNPGTALHHEQNLKKELARPTEIPEQRLVDPVVSELSFEGTVPVDSVRFESSISSITREELMSLVSGDRGREMTMGDIRALADRLATYCTEKGYPFVEILIPRQDLGHRILFIIVRKPEIDPRNPVVVEGTNLRMRDNIVRSYVAGSLHDAFSRSDLERSILNLNDNPGIHARAALQVGSVPGSTTIVVRADEEPPIRGTLSFDNYGNRYVGTWRSSFMVNINDPLKFGDQLMLSGVSATGEVFRMGTVGYSFPLLENGFRVSLSLTDLYYELGKGFATDPPGVGKAKFLLFTLRYPLYRNAETALMAGAGYDWKSLYNDGNGEIFDDSRIGDFSMALMGQWSDQLFGGGFSQLQAMIYAGHLDLTRIQKSFDTDQAADGAHTNGDYRKWTWQVLRIQQTIERLSLHLWAEGQFASKNLDYMEKMPLGGPTGVRAYPCGEALGDEGTRFSIDADYTLLCGTIFGDLTPSVFFDYGKIRQYRNPAAIAGLTTPNSYSLSGFGFGLELAVKGTYQFKLLWAKALGTNPGAWPKGTNADGLDGRSRFWLLGNLSF